MNSLNLRKEIEEAINRNSAENGSNTPDYILSQYLIACLAAYDAAVNKRERWYAGREPKLVWRHRRLISDSSSESEP